MIEETTLGVDEENSDDEGVSKIDKPQRKE